MLKKQILLAAAVIVTATALVFGTSSFDKKPEKKFGTYYYTYVGAQTPTERAKGTNYTNPQISAYPCSGTGNECAVKVTVPGAPPPDISTLSITYDATTGFPQVGGDLLQNFKKN